MQNIGRIVTDVTKVSNLAQSFLSTCRLMLEGVPVTNGPNYRLKRGGGGDKLSPIIAGWVPCGEYSSCLIWLKNICFKFLSFFALFKIVLHVHNTD